MRCVFESNPKDATALMWKIIHLIFIICQDFSTNFFVPRCRKISTLILFFCSKRQKIFLFTYKNILTLKSNIPIIASKKLRAGDICKRCRPSGFVCIKSVKFLSFRRASSSPRAARRSGCTFPRNCRLNVNFTAPPLLVEISTRNGKR